MGSPRSSIASSDVGADGADGVAFGVHSPFCVFHLESFVFTESKLLLLRMLNRKNKGIGPERVTRPRSTRQISELPLSNSKSGFKRRMRWVIDRSSYSHQLAKLIRLYLRLGLGLGEALLEAEADLKGLAWR